MSKYDEKERAWRKEYNRLPEVKERQKQHIKKYTSKPEVKEKLREYQRDYMREYWKNKPEQYARQKLRAAQANRVRNDRKKQFANKNTQVQQ